MTGRNADDASAEAVVRDTARAGDLDRYLAALLAPRAVRRDLIALTAFLGEVARIPSAVREPMMGEIRLQWWREALESAHKGVVTGSPVADALAGTMARHRLPLELLVAPIDARARDLDPGQPAEDISDYLRATQAAAFRLSARVLGVEETPAVADLLVASGQAYGRARLAAASRPAGGGPAQSCPRRHVRGSQRHVALLPGAPAAVLPAILPVALVEPYLAALEGAGPEITGEGAGISPLTRVWRLWWAKTRRRI